MRGVSISCRHCGKTIYRNLENGRKVVVCPKCKAVYEAHKNNNFISVSTLYIDFKSVS